MKKVILKEENPIEIFFRRRGLEEDEKREAFLNFTPEKLRKSYLDIEKVAGAIAEAVRNHKVITIYGDYDCDGINATVVILRGLKNLGCQNVHYHINKRFTEGYGMNVAGIDRILHENPDTQFIITCDNGIAAQEGILYAISKGIDVVCTDHHRQTGGLVVPTVDEWRDDEDAGAREECCGAEIARRVMMAVYDVLGVKDDEFFDHLITFTGIATVADVVKFTPANHWIAKRGIELLNNPVFENIKLMTQLIGCEGNVDEETVGYQIGPLYNAISRVAGESEMMVEFLMKDRANLESLEIIERLMSYNVERRELSTENLERAKDTTCMDDPCIIASGSYDPGIAGLVCSSLVEEYNRPVICLNLNEDSGVYKGSARSFQSFDLKNALDKCADLLLGYGGHAGAAGLSLKAENLEAFHERMNKLVSESGVLDEEVPITIEYIASVNDVYDSTVEKLMSFGPFGPGFEKPGIAYRGNLEKKVSLLPASADAEHKKHVSFSLREGNGKVGFIWWNSIPFWKRLALTAGKNLTVLGTPKFEVYNGHERFNIIVNDVLTDI